MKFTKIATIVFTVLAVGMVIMSGIMKFVAPEAGDLREAGVGVAREPGVEPGRDGVGRGGEEAVDGELGEPGACDLQQRVGDEEDDGGEDGEFVGQQEDAETAHELAVVDFAEFLFFLVVGHAGG